MYDNNTTSAMQDSGDTCENEREHREAGAYERAKERAEDGTDISSVL